MLLKEQQARRLASTAVNGQESICFCRPARLGVWKCCSTRGRTAWRATASNPARWQPLSQHGSPSTQTPSPSQVTNPFRNGSAIA